MRIRGWAILSVVLSAGMVCAGVRPQTTVPKSQGTTLAGTAVALPDALKGKVGVLVVGFSHASQGQVAAWGRRLAADYGKSQDVMFLEIPMLAGAPKMLRGMIVKSMGKSVPQEERPHFLPMMEGEPAWRAVAHYDKPDDAYVLIVDETGTVQWQTEGEATDAAYSDFKKNLEAVMAHNSAP
jgi:ATP10 protein